MKRILGALISSVMLAVTCLTALPVSAKEEYTEYIVPFYSDQTKQRQVLGISNKSLLKDGVVLIPLETACEIAGASIAAENDEAVLITRNYVSWCCKYKDEKNQYLLVDSHTGEGDYYESALDCLIDPPQLGELFQYSPYDNTFEFPVDFYHQTKISCQYYDNKFYVSFYEFLVMMGVDVDLINHEAINEITEFYTSMAEEYSGDEDYKGVISEIDKLFSVGTGYEQFFYCYLGTPIDELYKAYYDSDLMCDLGDYYGEGKVEWANLVNAVENYDGLTKTALAALNLNTDYEDVLINTVTYHGDSEDDNFSKTVDDSVDIIQRLLYVRDFGLSVDEIYRDDSVLETVWRMQEKADNIEPILSSVDDFDVDFSLSPDVISMVYSGLCGAMKNYAKYREMSNLFEGEQYLMKNTILSSDAMASNTTDEARGMFISHILNPMGNVIEMHSNLRNEENSYFNLYHSAAKVQETMNASSPAAWAAVWGAIEEATYSAGDDLIMGVIDYTFFGGMPVSSLVNSGILFCVDGLKNTAYGKEQSQIAELDDYVFLQEVAEDCFIEHSPASENARSSFILGLKATMLAYKTNGEDSSWDPNNKDSDSVKAYKEMNRMLNTSLSNSINTDFYNVFLEDCADLTEMLGSNTDISKLDTTPRQEITLEFGEETTETTEIPTESETIKSEKNEHNLSKGTGAFGELTYMNFGEYIEIIDCEEKATAIVIPDNIEGIPVTSIGRTAFRFMPHLSSVTIPYSITNISDEAFNDSYLIESLNVDSNNPNYSSIDGVLYNKNQTTLIRYPASKELADYVVPDTVKNIGSNAFLWCKNLSSITLTNNLNSIGDYAFGRCDSLMSITIPASVTYIGENAFTRYAFGERITVYGYNNSYAQRYANEHENSIDFVEIISSNAEEEIISYQQLYADELHKWIDSIWYMNAKFDLYDINADCIPELFISTGTPAHADQCKIYTVWNNQLKDLTKYEEYGEYGEVQCSNDSKTLLSSYYTNGHSYLSYYQIQNGELVCVLSTYCDAADVGLENATYKVNDVIVTKDEYNSKCAEYDAEYVAVGRKYSLDESTINSVLLSSDTRMGTIITENDALNVRQSPSTESSKIGIIDKGSTVTIFSETNGWYEIEFNGKSGYVLGEYVQIVE